MVNKPKRKLRRPTVPKKGQIALRKKVLTKKKMSYFPKYQTKNTLLMYGLIVVSLAVVMWIYSIQLIKYAVEISTAFLLVSFSLILLVAIIIIFLQRRLSNYSHPIWVITLGIIVSFVGFTLSASFQEMVKNAEEKHKLTLSLFNLSNDLVAQRDGLERTIFDFRTVLFDEHNDGNEKRKFYVRKQLSVYNESDVKPSSLDFEFYTQGGLMLNTTADTSSISEIYKDLTFQSTDPEEMLQSYSELISLYYQVDERVSFLSARYQYLRGEKSVSEINKHLKKSQKNNKDLALRLIDDLEKMTEEKYPEVNFKIDKKTLLE